MKMNRNIVHLSRAGAEPPEAPAAMTKAEAFAFVWELTQEVFSLSGRYDAESRLQRHVVSIARKQG